MIEDEKAPLDELVAETLRALSVLCAGLPVKRNNAHAELLLVYAALGDANFTLERLIAGLEEVAPDLQQEGARASEVLSRAGGGAGSLPEQLTRMVVMLGEVNSCVFQQQLLRKQLLERQLDRLYLAGRKILTFRDVIEGARY